MSIWKPARIGLPRHGRGLCGAIGFRGGQGYYVHVDVTRDRFSLQSLYHASVVFCAELIQCHFDGIPVLQPQGNLFVLHAEKLCLNAATPLAGPSSRFGDSDSNAEQHGDISQGFWMAKYEVTQAEYLGLTGTNLSQATWKASPSTICREPPATKAKSLCLVVPQASTALPSFPPTIERTWK